MTILTTIKRLFKPERETLWLLFSLNSDPNYLNMYFRTTGDRNTVSGDPLHYDIITSLSSDFRGFIHTHPSDASLTPSLSDILTVSAWERAVGRPLLNIIASGDLKEFNAYYDGRPLGKQISIFTLSGGNKMLRISNV